MPVFDASLDHAVIDEVLAAYARAAPGFRRLKPPLVVPDLPRGPMGKTPPARDRGNGRGLKGRIRRRVRVPPDFR